MNLVNPVTLTVPLSQHTASVSTFENTEHLCLIFVVFFQQVAIRKHADCSRSSSKKHGKSELRLVPHPKLKTCPTTFLWQPRRRHFTLANQISITNISHFSKKTDFSISVKLQNNFTLFNGAFILRTL